MTCSRCECAYLSVLIGIVAGVLLGVLYALGFVATGIIFWLYLVLGAAGVLLAPIYAGNSESCFCRYRLAFSVASVGGILTSAIGLILAALPSLIATAIAISLATFFSVMLVVLAICFTNCICSE